jgi:DNA-binding NtrC family response regulator
VRGLRPEVVEIFRRYSWPGNVRELRNVIERVMILEDGELITSTYLPRDLARGDSLTAHAAGSGNHQLLSGIVLPPEGIVLDDVEMSLVSQALERVGGNQTRAAELLGISRDQLRYRLKKLQETTAGQ